jgi:hypothetical protein
MKASLGVPQIFLGNVGRLNEDRFSKYTIATITEMF